MERRSIVIHGTVQGVGFRPFVFALASKLKLGGSVKNAAGSVLIDVEGDALRLDQFLHDLIEQAPPLARITALSWEHRQPLGDCLFNIEPSDCAAAGPVVIAPDSATCADCLAELFNPLDRRFNYPFLNCTHCGPRLTIVTGVPYDRERTTMAGFPMCVACRAEYDDPSNRRFHAQPTACPACGPQLTAVDAEGRSLTDKNPLGLFVDAIKAGRIGAMKGLGGFHLICDATNSAAVSRLRARKHRDEKPFAVMVADLQSAKSLCDIGAAEEQLLISPRRPIVILKKKTALPLAAEVAPENPFIGLMLPYTPLHHLLLRAIDRLPLVMTSGNSADEPIAFENAEAITSLGQIADLMLLHDRPIHVRCDDSVTRIIDSAESPVRRSRGDAPRPIALPMRAAKRILAVGGQAKATFALGLERQAIVSHHLGDLDHFKAFQAFERDIKLYEQVFQTKPALIAHDLHPDYASTGYALARSRVEGIQLIGVQHHHAHMASCMAENGLSEPVIGVTFDGTGYGLDGAIWGGEFLLGDYRSFKRAAHLRYVAMPGGERAVREPWRMAVAYAMDAGSSFSALEKRLPAASINVVKQMITRGLNSPPTSGMGRLFDAVASLIGVRDTASFEGQAAVQLEWLADSVTAQGSYPFEFGKPVNDPDGPMIIDMRPMISAICNEGKTKEDLRVIARRFHSTLVNLVVSVCMDIRRQFSLCDVVLSGGTFMNALLSIECSRRLAGEGFRVFRHGVVPPNDGGLCLGQLAVAAGQSMAD